MNTLTIIGVVICMGVPTYKGTGVLALIGLGSTFKIRVKIFSLHPNPTKKYWVLPPNSMKILNLFT